MSDGKPEAHDPTTATPKAARTTASVELQRIGLMLEARAIEGLRDASESLRTLTATSEATVAAIRKVIAEG